MPDKDEKKTIRVAVYFGEKDHEKLKKLAGDMRLSVPQFVRMKIMEIVDPKSIDPEIK